MGNARAETGRRQLFANSVESVMRKDPFVDISLGLRATHGRHAGKVTPALKLVLTSQCASDLVRWLTRDHD